ncbi:MAG: SprT family zinc-dependent metalloprotease [Thermodesulfobacteriota bacterium]|nr:SprT family zinc-dependent metalloprotease [Thermodesulfobacteriota bacterium]
MKNKATQHVLHFGNRRIPYYLHRAERKRLRIVVTPDMIVDVFAPTRAKEDGIREALGKKAPWIVRTLDKVQEYHPLSTPRRYVSGETLVYLGRQYRLKVQNSSNQTAKLLGRFLCVWVEDKADTKRIKRAVEAWYRKRARETLSRYMEKCHVIASRHGVPEPLLAIRAMGRRWGSCSPARSITLNLRLVQVPVHCIEYVIMHELCHLKYHDHSKSFYRLLTRCQPDWRKRKETLDRFRLS